MVRTDRDHGGRIVPDGEDDDRDRRYMTVLHSPWTWGAFIACALFWLLLVVWLVLP